MNENIGTRGNKFTMFSYIRPREFIDRNNFYAGYEKLSEIKKKKKTRKDFDQEQ